MKNGYETRILRIAFWALVAGTVPVGEILPAESHAILVPARGARTAATHATRAGKVQVRSALLSSEELRDLPRQLYQVTLESKNALWARAMTRTPEGFEIQPITGERIRVKKSQVIQVSQISRGAYLAQRWKEIQTARRSSLLGQTSSSLRSSTK